MSLPDLYLIGTVLVVAICASLMARLLPPRSPTPPRHGALQGFRGLLAFGVFMHHSFIWSHYAHGQGWLDSEGFRQFGESRVVLFFMLTATLFYGRLLDARGRNLDWLKLYVSRVLRLSPAYAFSMVLMFAVIAWATVHQIDGAGTSIVKFTWSDIVGTATTWLAFCMLGMPSIDAYMATPAVTAGVTWTMPYEVTFYLLLPLLALPLRVRMPATTLGLGLAAAIWTMLWPSTPEYCVPFAGGLAVAMLVRLPRVVAVLRRRFFAVPAMAAMISAIVFFPTVYAPVPLLLLFFSMAVFACDNDLFGILRWRAPQALGQWAYSLYLLHGIALYTLFLSLIHI